MDSQETLDIWKTFCDRSLIKSIKWLDGNFMDCDPNDLKKAKDAINESVRTLFLDLESPLEEQNLLLECRQVEELMRVNTDVKFDFMEMA